MENRLRSIVILLSMIIFIALTVYTGDLFNVILLMLSYPLIYIVFKCASLIRDAKLDQRIAAQIGARSFGLSQDGEETSKST